MAYEDYAGNTIIDTTFEDRDLPRGIERIYANAYFVENESREKVKKECRVRNWKRDGGGRGMMPVGSLYEHNGKWRQKFISWNLWKFER